MTLDQKPSPAWGCETVVRARHAYLDNEVEPGAAAAIRTHLGRCPSCRARYDDERAFTDVLQQSLTGCGDPASTHLLREKIRAGLAWSGASRFSPSRVAALAASVFLVGCLTGALSVVVWRGATGPGPSETIQAKVEDLRAIAAEVMALTQTQEPSRVVEVFHGDFPGVNLPVAGLEGAPKPRLAGRSRLGPGNVSWVIYCTGAGAPAFTERFVLITAHRDHFDSMLSGLNCLEFSDGELQTIVWRDGECFRMLVTRSGADWARLQRSALMGV